MLWQRVGDYYVMSDTNVRRIFPKNERTGKSVPVTLIKHTVILRHESSPEGDASSDVIFSRYLHQKQWHWRDSRCKATSTRTDVVSEISRMLKLDEAAAENFVKQRLAA